MQVAAKQLHVLNVDLFNQEQPSNTDLVNIW